MRATHFDVNTVRMSRVSNDLAPRLSWALESEREGDARTANRIVVGDLWVDMPERRAA
jgi:hypothetical protein